MSRDPLALHYVRAFAWGVPAFWCFLLWMMLIAWAGL